jgi:hypothetical protein
MFIAVNSRTDSTQNTANAVVAAARRWHREDMARKPLLTNASPLGLTINTSIPPPPPPPSVLAPSSSLLSPNGTNKQVLSPTHKLSIPVAAAVAAASGGTTPSPRPSASAASASTLASAVPTSLGGMSSPVNLTLTNTLESPPLTPSTPLSPYDGMYVCMAAMHMLLMLSITSIHFISCLMCIDDDQQDPFVVLDELYRTFLARAAPREILVSEAKRLYFQRTITSLEYDR